MMKQAGESCVSDILTLCETHLGYSIDAVDDLVYGWNMLRESKKLKVNGRLE